MKSKSVFSSFILLYFGIFIIMSIMNCSEDSNPVKPPPSVPVFTWTEETITAEKPSARSYHEMAWAGDDNVLLFGGFDGSYLGDSWLYNLNTNSWAAQSISGPSGRSSQSMAHIEDNKILMFGGTTAPGVIIGETWIFDRLASTWTQDIAGTDPSPRYDCAMAYIGDDQVLLFGGFNGSYLGDTWMYDLSNGSWTDLAPPAGQPGARSAHDMAYIGEDQVLLFGGHNAGELGNTWIYDLSTNTWTNKNPSGDIPSDRFYHSLAYIGGERVLLFGGNSATGDNNDTWIYDLSTNSWILEARSIPPAQCSRHALSESSMDGSGDLVLFGGSDGTDVTITGSFKDIPGTNDPTTVPELNTDSVSTITYSTALCGGTITSDGGANINTRGVCWSTTETPLVSDNKTNDGVGIGDFTSEITGLTPETIYYVRAYATNSAGTGYGSTISFTTASATVPVLTTTSVSAITSSSANCGGTISSDGGETVHTRGVCWSTSETPTVSDNKTEDGDGVGTFTSEMTGLTLGTTYFVRAYATNSVGTGYGSTMSFITDLTLTDIDGNVYKVVKIGYQFWMAENLKVTHYRNGEAIPNVTNSNLWYNLRTGAYCNYNNDTNNASTYGRLYNFYAVDDSRNLAPAGWHVPSDAEWQTLVDYLGGESVAGGKMKTTSGWYNNGNGSNSSGFSALPGGFRWEDGTFSYVGSKAAFLSSTESGNYGAWARTLDYVSSGVVSDNYYKQSGFSVRCVKD